MDESDRWFHITQERKREHATRVRRAQKRIAEAARRAASLDRAFGGKTAARMNLTGWEIDEHGNLSRTLYGR